MARNSKLYIPPKKAQYFQPQAKGLQWWYHDAGFDNGYTISLVWHTLEKGGMVQFDVCDPDGNVINIQPVFDATSIVASTDSLDVKMGNNHMHGEYPRYEVHFRDGDVGADLVYECIVQEFIEPPDGLYMGRELNPATPTFFGYVYRPRCKVTGKLIVKGKEIPVKGEGYADHQWSDVGVRELFHYWHWGKAFLPKYTVYWWFAMLPADMGYQTRKWLWVYEDQNLIEYLANADMYAEMQDMKLDAESGIEYPQKMIIHFDEDIIKGNLTYTMKKLFYTTPIMEKRAEGWNRYFREIADCKADLEINGHKVSATNSEVFEVGL